VAALSVTASVTIRLAGGVRLPAVATTQRKGTVPTGIATGREPGGPGEIALSPRVAERLGLDIGDVVTAVGPRGPVPLTVTGTVIAVDDNGNLGDLVAVAPAQVPALAEGAPLMRAQIVAGPDQTGALQSELGQQLEIVPRAMSTQVRNLADLVRLPEILAVVLGVVAGAAMAHLLLTTARRHRREMTVLAVLGATPGQVRAALAVLAGATVLPALLIGIPLGIGVARVLWWQVATSIGVAGDLAVPLGLLGAAAAAVLAVALLLAVVPGLRAIRGAPAVLLTTT
jgi:putative ABC transport system permease protein